jgi:hypothetical protein
VSDAWAGGEVRGGTEVTTEYVARLVNAYPAIREVWRYGSRANGTANDASDWDYLAFADDDTLSDLSRDTRFHQEGIDLMIVTDGTRFAKPWIEGTEGQKTGTLAAEFGGLHWCTVSDTEATYQATKPELGPVYRTRVFPQRAVRVFP